MIVQDSVLTLKVSSPSASARWRMDSVLQENYEKGFLDFFTMEVLRCCSPVFSRIQPVSLTGITIAEKLV